MRITSFLLITYYTLRIKTNKSALKAILLNKIEDFCLTFFIAFIHNLMLTGDNTLINLLYYNYSKHSDITYITRTLLIICAATKSAQMLFSIWLPDAMEGPTPVSALLHSSTMVTARYVLLTKYYSASLFNSLLSNFILYLRLLTYYSSTSKTIVCEDSKGSIAYSTIAQMGNLFIALVILP